MKHWWGDNEKGKQKHWEKNLLQWYFFTTNLTWTDLRLNSGLRGERLVTNSTA